MIRRMHFAFLSLCFCATVSFAGPKPCSVSEHTEYGKKIKEFTTESFFSTELVDHLPLTLAFRRRILFFITSWERPMFWITRRTSTRIFVCWPARARG